MTKSSSGADAAASTEGVADDQWSSRPTDEPVAADVIDVGDAGSPVDGAVRSSCEDELEAVVASLEFVTAERDDYLDLARRLQADFENFRKRVETQRADQIARAAEQLVLELLPVLDACEAAIVHGATDVAPIHSMLDATLTKLGLAKVADVDATFDPNVHEAVMSEPGDGDDGPVVAEIMRTGYLWNGRVVRPAMVKVRG